MLMPDLKSPVAASARAFLAELGTTQTVISRLEGGVVTPTLPLLHHLAGALGGELDLKITGMSAHAEFPLAS